MNLSCVYCYTWGVFFKVYLCSDLHMKLIEHSEAYTKIDMHNLGMKIIAVWYSELKLNKKRCFFLCFLSGFQDFCSNFPSTYHQGVVQYDIKSHRKWFLTMLGKSIENLYWSEKWVSSGILSEVWVAYSKPSTLTRPGVMRGPEVPPPFRPSLQFENIFLVILDDRLKEKLLKPWKGALCSHFRVCLSVRP